MPWLDIKGTVVADTVYVDKRLAAKDVAFTLPAVTLLTADVQAMGTMSMPLVGLLEDMELAITKIGIDKGLSSMSKLEKLNIEFRWVQNVVKADGTTTPEGCKAFVRCIPKALPGLGVEVGAATEGELTYGVSRLQIFAAGSEYLLVDRLSQILRVNGKDYMKNINNLL